MLVQPQVRDAQRSVTKPCLHVIVIAGADAEDDVAVCDISIGQ